MRLDQGQAGDQIKVSWENSPEPHAGPLDSPISCSKRSSEMSPEQFEKAVNAVLEWEDGGGGSAADLVCYLFIINTGSLVQA